MPRPKRPPAEPTPEVKFDYIKSNLFRVVYADGVHGGLTPSAKLQIAFWNQRFPIPQQTVQRIKPDGNLGDEVLNKRVARDAVVREVEVSVLMDLNMAENLRDWLDNHIKTAKQVGDKKTRIQNGS